MKSAPSVDSETLKSDANFDLIVDKIAARENLFVKSLQDYTPIMETYIQNMRTDQNLGPVPISDEYFLGRVKLEQSADHVNFILEHGSVHKKTRASVEAVQSGNMADRFAQMIVIDMGTFDRQHYEFRLVRDEFLGGLRTLVIDVKPRQPQTKAMFIGRIWAEDQNYNIVRFNGSYTPQPRSRPFMHFDSWRENIGYDQWLPAYVYTEESDLVGGRDRWNFRAQTLLWGYQASRAEKTGELTGIVVDTTGNVKGQADSRQGLTKIPAQRAWQRQTEDNVLDRMQRAALVAPEGEVDKVLDVVVHNIEVSNNIEIEPEIRCRVLLTEPAESFTVGHTIVVSRGLLDVLPDEAALAMILAHEMGRILANHQLNEKYAFSDTTIFPNETTISKFQISRTPAEEKEADAKGLELLQNSPYKNKLGSASLFLAAVQAKSPQLPHLLKGHFGKPFETKESGVRVSSLAASAPTLQDQSAALPLGGRIKLNAWSNQLSIRRAVQREMIFNDKTPFAITYTLPY
jgi:hypothetical protein